MIILRWRYDYWRTMEWRQRIYSNLDCNIGNSPLNLAQTKATVRFVKSLQDSHEKVIRNLEDETKAKSITMV